eukprot:1161157-Pelagomonas_calceolata.AAC.8
MQTLHTCGRITYEQGIMDRPRFLHWCCALKASTAAFFASKPELALSSCRENMKIRETIVHRSVQLQTGDQPAPSQTRGYPGSCCAPTPLKQCLQAPRAVPKNGKSLFAHKVSAAHKHERMRSEQHMRS